MSDEEQARHREERRVAAAEHAAAADRARAAETERARRLIADFVHQAAERGVPAEPLLARAYNGRTTYRTPLRGWYLKRDRSVAVGDDGEYYVLTVPASVKARFSGVAVPPAEPPMIVGAGARDGESMPLAALLQRRLDGGADGPP